MGRIRTIKPEFPQSESMGRVSRDARLLFVLLWTVADDEGRTRGSSRMLASILYPYDDDAPRQIEKWLTELERECCIVRYRVDGSTYLQICKWLTHQKIDKPSASKLPAPSEDSRTFANDREASALDLDQDQGRDQDQGKGKEGKRARAPAVACPPDVDAQVWTDWCQLRKAKRAPVTTTVLDGARKEAGKAGLTLAEFLAIWCRRGSQGLEAAWLKPEERKPAAKGKTIHDLSTMNYGGPDDDLRF